MYSVFVQYPLHMSLKRKVKRKEKEREKEDKVYNYSEIVNTNVNIRS